MFFKRKENERPNPDTHSINTVEYEKCLRRFAERDEAIELLKAKVKGIESEMADLSRKFVAKLRGLKREEENENINSDDPKYI